MSEKIIEPGDIQGLLSQQVPVLLRQYGKNIFESGSTRRFIHIIWDIIKESMFILLVIGCSLYFILDEVSEGIMMLVAMSIVTTISLYQEVKSSHALAALKQLTEPGITVFRDGEKIIIPTEELVPGDIILLNRYLLMPLFYKKTI